VELKVTLGARKNSSKVGASRCDARTAQRDALRKEMKNSVLRPLRFFNPNGIDEWVLATHL
jgi:hypothetical protein